MLQVALPCDRFNRLYFFFRKFVVKNPQIFFYMLFVSSADKRYYSHMQRKQE
ncbi:hypothetical protein KsCSTR_12440 [Candidatus Kuenenia stuttgartiensis]|uniref:Uncharacterized protein n=1 Tax=Kuenenia stuttgartiensis TaxID=174633 RepID=Q1Q0H2_KUEST|nr:hypothetical protein KsCSTR_12440 [Candidatus Kuenenia stuttgartiensis]CAJ72029.1 unknown protein [Candidatus Kuenenia stuttgartiensis]